MWTPPGNGLGETRSRPVRRDSMLRGMNTAHTKTVDSTATDLIQLGELRRLARAASAGDERAWCRLQDRFERQVWAWTRSSYLTREDREDIAAIAFATLFRRLRDGAIDDPDRIPGYLRVVVRNEVRRTFRKRLGEDGRVIELSTDGEALERQPAPSTEHDIANELRSYLYHRLAEGALAPKDRAFIETWLSTCGTDHQYRTMAATLDRPLGAIGPTFQRCAAKLKRALEADGFVAADWV